jgi:hypothetical protein
VTDFRVVVVDGLHQADVADLHQVLGWFGAAAILPDTGPDQLLMPLDQDLADCGAQVAVTRLGTEAAEQFVVGQLGQVRARTGGAGRCLRHGDLRGVRECRTKRVCPWEDV